jgi:hypothetical protein
MLVMDEQQVERLSRRRARLGVWMAMAFLLVLACIAANDALVQAGNAVSPQRIGVLVGLVGAGILLVTTSWRYAALARRSMVDPELRRKLWDELAITNHVRAMALGYMLMLAVAMLLAVTSMFTTLSAPWVVNLMLVTGLAVPALAFAIFERRGDDPGA